MAQSAGESDSAVKAESSTEIAMVRANCWYMRPVRPPRKATGRNTAERMSAMPMTGAETSFMAWIVASLGSHPVLEVVHDRFDHDDGVVNDDADGEDKAEHRERVYRETDIGKKIKVPMSETGTASSGMIVARKFCRKIKTTMVTRMIASTNVWTIPSIEASTAGVVS